VGSLCRDHQLQTGRLAAVGERGDHAAMIQRRRSPGGVPTWHSCISSLLKSSMAAVPGLQAVRAVAPLGVPRLCGACVGSPQSKRALRSSSQARGEDAGDWRLGVRRRTVSVDNEIVPAASLRPSGVCRVPEMHSGPNPLYVAVHCEAQRP
jgi:hypothetical protein